MTATSPVEIILGNSQPLTPQPTGTSPQLSQLRDIRAVLFDIYGTLLISASGDIGASTGDHRPVALAETCQRFNLALNCSPADGLKRLESEITAVHDIAKQQGNAYPEIDIVEIWQAVLTEITDSLLNLEELRRFALEYEVRVNPVWPMPEAASTLTQLANSELILGIVSNAQFFTPLLFPPLLDNSLEEFGFAPQLLYFSYEHRQAKPGSFLYGLARQQLEAEGIRPQQVLYVGNDMLNDVAAAASVGFRTALFAGDRRSLRWREGDQRVQGITPDLVITELTQLLTCLAHSITK